NQNPSPRRIRAWMQAPIEVSRRYGEVFLLDILSQRMSVITCSRHVTLMIAISTSAAYAGIAFVEIPLCLFLLAFLQWQSRSFWLFQCSRVAALPTRDSR